MCARALFFRSLVELETEFLEIVWGDINRT